MWIFNDGQVVFAHNCEPAAAPAPTLSQWERAWKLAACFGHGWATRFESPDEMWGPVVMSAVDADGATAIPAVPIEWVRLEGKVVPAKAALAWFKDTDGAMPSLGYRSSNGHGRYEWWTDGSATHLRVHRPGGIALEATVRDRRVESIGMGDVPFRMRHVDALRQMLSCLDVTGLADAWMRGGLPFIRLDDLDASELLALLWDSGMRVCEQNSGGTRSRTIEVEKMEDGYVLVHVIDAYDIDGKHCRTRRIAARLVYTDEDCDDLKCLVEDERVFVDIRRTVKTALQTLPLVSLTWDFQAEGSA